MTENNSETKASQIAEPAILLSLSLVILIASRSP